MSYVKTTWASGDVITADKLNNIEGGIEENSLAIGDTAELTEDDLVDAVNDLKEGKADADGVYEGMTVGNAEQLVSSVFIEDQEPYFFRTSGGSNDIGDREYDELVGGSLGWNQLASFADNLLPSARAGITVTSSDNKSVTYNGTSTGYTAGGWYNLSEATGLQGTDGHKALFTTKVISGTITGQALTLGLSGSSAINVGGSTVVQLVKDSLDHIRLTDAIPSGSVCTDYTITFNVIDLTTLFGTTIADYVYSLEQATAGAGVAWVRRYLTAEYYPFCAPTLKHVEGVSAHVLTGFNLMNFELYRRLASSMSTLDVSKAVRVMSGCKYEINFESIENATNWRFGLYCFDFEGNRLLNGVLANGGDLSFNGSANYYVNGANITEKRSTFTPLFNGYVMPFVCAGDTSDSTVIHKGCLHLYWDGERDGEYEPYEEHSYPLDGTWVGRGVPKLDASNKLYFDGDIYSADGTVTRNVIEIDFKDLAWEKSLSGNKFYAKVTPYPWSDSLVMVCAKYAFDEIGNSVHGYFGDDKTLRYSYSNMTPSSDSYEIYVHDEAYSTTQAFASANEGTKLVYKLATPTIAEAEPFTTPQIVSDWGTEEYVTTGVVPVGHDTRYHANLKAKLEMAPNSPSGDGEYVVKQEDGENSYVPLIIPKELPDAPSTDGTYTLKCTVSGGTAAYSWES